MKKAFTLIELLVVVAIIGILAAVGTPIFQGFILDAKIVATQENHIRVRDFIATSFIKCSTGSPYIVFVVSLKGKTKNVSCDENTNILGKYFAGHLSYIMKNPYGDPSWWKNNYSRPAVDSVYAIFDPQIGRTHLYATGSNCSRNNRYPKYSYIGCNMIRIFTNIGDKDGNTKVIVHTVIKE
jgi:type IV pilus assembly protein PilA